VTEDRPRIVITVAEVNASMMRGVLTEAGIKSMLVPVGTSELGLDSWNVLVAGRDYDRAVAVLREVRGDPPLPVRRPNAVGRMIERLLGGQPPPRETDAFGRPVSPPDS
jgi:hypothetical protein